MNLSCAECGKDSGNSLVCPDCIPMLSAYKRDKIMKAWHRAIIEAAGNACESCGHTASVESGELCGDHIQTKGARPDLVFDVINGRCVCLACHNQRHSQGLPKGEKKAAFKKPPVCEVKGCPRYAIEQGGRNLKRCCIHR